MSVAKLVTCSVDFDQLGQVAVTLGHLVAADAQMCNDVLDEGVISRLSVYITKFLFETSLTERILFFM